VDTSRNPNQAPQRVSPKPWVTPAGQSVPAQPPTSPELPNSFKEVGVSSIGSFLQPPRGETTNAAQADLNATLATLTGMSADVEIKEDLAACKGRLDAVGLRLSGQDNAVKALERSLSALREEYSKISQTIDGQSLSRLEACERSVARLEGAFQEFSTGMQREARATENMIATQAQASIPAIMCRLLENDGDVNKLETVHLHLPLHLNTSSDVCLHKRKFNSTTNLFEETDFVVQTAAGDPRVVFI